MEKFTNNICNKTLNGSSLFQLHELMHTDARPFKCEECSKEFKRKSHLKNHLYLHSKVKEHTCEHCNKSFASISILKRHTKRHLFERIFKCEHCSKSFFELTKLRRHLDSHSNFRQHQCGYCQHSFMNQADLKRHLLSHSQDQKPSHNPADKFERPKIYSKQKLKNLTCTYCGKILSTMLSLKEHINIHLGTKPHKCDQCDKTFNRQIELQRHLLRHSGHRPYACIDCERCFFSQSELSRHTFNLHVSISVLRCNYCSASFYELSHLNEHIKLHCVTDAHVCNFCNSTFQLFNDFQLHQGTCLKKILSSQSLKFKKDLTKIELRKAKYFPCTYCSKKFFFKSIQMTHMRKHNLKRPIRCNLCFDVFSHRSHLLAHMITHKKTKKLQNSIFLHHSNMDKVSNMNQFSLNQNNLSEIKKKMQDTEKLKINVDLKRFNKSPKEMWECAGVSSFKGGEQPEIVSCEVQLTFTFRPPTTLDTNLMVRTRKNKKSTHDALHR